MTNLKKKEEKAFEALSRASSRVIKLEKIIENINWRLLVAKDKFKNAERSRKEKNEKWTEIYLLKEKENE